MHIAESTPSPDFSGANDLVSNDPSPAATPYPSRVALNEIGVISGIRNIIVPARNEQGVSGLETDLRFPSAEEIGASRGWIEITPPTRTVALVLRGSPAGEPRDAHSFPATGSAVFLNCVDFQRTRDDLSQRGVRFSAPPARMPFGWISMFEDDEGRRYVLGEWLIVASD